MVNTFGKPIIPSNDSDRLQNLDSYKILDTKAENIFDNIAEIARKYFDVPIALVALVDKERVWFKANKGMESTKQVSRGVSLCSLAVLDDNPTVFENALEEPCLLANPLVTGKFGLRFYAGAPLRTPEGFNIGTVCIVDKSPRDFSQEQREDLKRISDIVMDILIEKKK